MRPHIHLRWDTRARVKILKNNFVYNGSPTCIGIAGWEEVLEAYWINYLSLKLILLGGPRLCPYTFITVAYGLGLGLN